MITGESFEEVRDKLADFRVNNNVPIGDPGQDILSHYANNWPWMVMHDDQPSVNKEQSREYINWRRWIYRIWNNPPLKTVSTKEASMRWDVCKKCPRNKKMEWEETKESSELARRAFLMRRGIDIPKETGFCDCHNWDISVVSFVETPRELSGKLKDSADQPGCWV